MHLDVVLIMGPTASGKSDLAIALAEVLPVEIISVDSAMVYRGLDIGTAKPSPGIRNRLIHHLIDIRDPSEVYSCAQFRTDAIALIEQIHAQQRVPLLVGGSMLYFRSLQYGMSAIPAVDAQIRLKLMGQAKVRGLASLHGRLRKLDPRAADRIHPNDPQRIIRALEVYEATGKPLSSYWDTPVEPLPWCWHKLILRHGQQHKRNALIIERFARMLRGGLVAEVASLYQRGDLNGNLPALRTVGYRQVWAYLAGQINYAQMQDKAITATRQLAKRQLTWLRAQPDGQWFEVEDETLLEKIQRYLAANILQQ